MCKIHKAVENCKLFFKNLMRTGSWEISGNSFLLNQKFHGEKFLSHNFSKLGFKHCQNQEVQKHMNI